MGVNKRIKTAKELDPSQRFMIYSITEAKAMRQYINNPPKPSAPHFYSREYMHITLDHAGAAPLDLPDSESYLVVDTITHYQKIVCVFRAENGQQLVLPIGETKYQTIDYYNQPTYKWLRVRKLVEMELTRLYK